MERKKSGNVIWAAAACALVWSAEGALAQDKAAMQEKVAAVKQSLAANQKALMQYSWIETTAISMKGEVKKTVKKECRYGTDGKVIKTEMAGAPAPAAEEPEGRGRRGGRGGGAAKAKIIENKVEDLKEYMAAVAALVKQYVPPDPAKLQAAAQAGKASLDKEKAPGIAELSFADYAVPGDKLALAFNTGTKQMAGVNVNSVLGEDKDPVTLAVRFAALADGVSYPAETLLTAAAKQIEVKITNSGHKK
jgi:hypothetical protein